MITLKLYWWYLPIALFLIPFIYSKFRKSSGSFDLQIDTMLICAVCWFSAIGILLGKLF